MNYDSMSEAVYCVNMSNGNESARAAGQRLKPRCTAMSDSGTGNLGKRYCVRRDIRLSRVRTPVLRTVLRTEVPKRYA